jgi:hypothetical protein
MPRLPYQAQPSPAGPDPRGQCKPPTPRRCPLRNDWKAWDRAKRADRLFMVCPACKVYGSHVDGIDA